MAASSAMGSRIGSGGRVQMFAYVVASKFAFSGLVLASVVLWWSVRPGAALGVLPSMALIVFQTVVVLDVIVSLVVKFLHALVRSFLMVCSACLANWVWCCECVVDLWLLSLALSLALVAISISLFQKGFLSMCLPRGMFLCADVRMAEVSDLESVWTDHWLVCDGHE